MQMDRYRYTAHIIGWGFAGRQLGKRGGVCGGVKAWPTTSKCPLQAGVSECSFSAQGVKLKSP